MITPDSFCFEGTRFRREDTDRRVDGEATVEGESLVLDVQVRWTCNPRMYEGCQPVLTARTEHIRVSACPEGSAPRPCGLAGEPSGSETIEATSVYPPAPVSTESREDEVRAFLDARPYTCLRFDGVDYFHRGMERGSCG